MTDRTVIVIAGPTASGKSGLALALAERLAARGGAVIVNADSMQVYRGLGILTAQPDAAARARAPHVLYGVLEPDDPCSAGRWRAMALAEIDKAFEAGRTPIVVGGTGLYLKALTEGIAPVPDIPPDVRARVRARLAEIGNAAFHRELAARDADAARRIAPGDSQRMVRALEVLEATGKTLAHWQSLPPDGPPPGLRFVTVLLDPPRAVLYAAIEARLEKMVTAGALEEARRLAALARDGGLDPDLPALKALGVAELAAAARGELPVAEAIARAKTASRHYAKRQATWARGQIVADITFREKFSERDSERILSEILKFPLT